VCKINLFTECTRSTLHMWHECVKLARVMHTIHICNSYSVTIKHAFSAEEPAHKEETIVKVRAKACL